MNKTTHKAAPIAWATALLRKVQAASPLLIHKGQHGAHMAYLTLVSIEAHGWYGKAAALMLVLAIVAHFAGITGEGE